MVGIDYACSFNIPNLPLRPVGCWPRRSGIGGATEKENLRVAKRRRTGDAEIIRCTGAQKARAMPDTQTAPTGSPIDATLGTARRGSALWVWASQRRQLGYDESRAVEIVPGEGRSWIDGATEKDRLNSNNCFRFEP